MTPHLRVLFAVVVLLLSLHAPPPLLAQTGSVPEAFTAIRVDGTGERGGSTVDIAIGRWSTEHQKDQLARTLLAHGPEALLAELRETTPVGTIHSPGSLPWDLRFAWQERTPDGGRRVLIITDRPIDWWEIILGSPSVDYPFSLIELRLNADGEGEGKLSVATKITVDRSLDVIELENYDAAPLKLIEIRSRHST
jgi:hypothetical protein